MSAEPTTSSATTGEPHAAEPAQREPQAKDMETLYDQHKSYAAVALREYEQHYKELVQHLSCDHLEPLAKILLDKEQVVLQREPLMESLRQAVLVRLQGAMAQFWSESDVDNGLTSLQILKEKFKEYEGTNWNVVNKTPAERTLPIHMNFKNMCKRHLLKQLQYQEGLLKTTLEANKKHRLRIQEIAQERVYLRGHMERSRKQMDELSSKLVFLQMRLIRAQESVEDTY